MSYRVVQWATGSVGTRALRGILEHPELELAGVRVYSDSKAGRDAGELCGAGRTGITATTDAGAILALDADCVLYAPRLPDHAEIARLLESGKNVVSVAANMYPRAHGREVFDLLEAACRKGGVSFHGSGINPAFMSDVLPLTLSGLTRHVRQITVEEVSDVNHYASTAPEIMLDHLGFGKPPAEATADDSGFIAWMTAYFGESLLMIADHLGATLERVVENHEVAVARRRVALAEGLAIEPGTVACRRFEWQGIVHGRPAIVLRTFWKTTRDIEPRWPVGAEEPVKWTVTIEGTPSYRCEVTTARSYAEGGPGAGEGGEEMAVMGTALHAVNAIPYVCEAEPGIRTFLDLPIIACRKGLDTS